jgi:hypothetical protein
MRAVWLVLATIACGGDPILDKAREFEAEERAGTRPAPTAGGAAGGAADGAAGGAAAVVVPSAPGIPDEVITPGIPDEPAPAPPGTSSEGVTPGIPDEPAPAEAGAPWGGDTGSVTITPGVPDEPAPAPAGAPGGSDTGAIAVTPGVPDEPAPGAPGTAGGAAHADKQVGFEGPTTTLRGWLRMDESIQAKIKIDVFDGDQRNIAGPRPSLVTVASFDRPGEFEIEVPLSAKRVWLSAYADTTGDGRPSKGEPTGWYPGNPVFLSDAPDVIVIELVADKKAVGLGLDFGQ